MVDALKDLPRLSEEAMGPCISCDRQLLGTGLPIFFRIDAKQCGLDRHEIQRHVGLAMSMGGGTDGLALAGIMGPGVKPIIVMETITGFNVCHECASNGISVMDAIGRQWERDRRAKGLPVPPKAYRYEEEDCPGHVASDDDMKVCAECGTHVDSLRPPEEGEM